MPQPSSTDVHVDAPLTNLSVGFKNDMNSFVADKVFPTVPVAKQTDKFFTFTQADFFRTDAKLSLRVQVTNSALPRTAAMFLHFTKTLQIKLVRTLMLLWI